MSIRICDICRWPYTPVSRSYKLCDECVRRYHPLIRRSSRYESRPAGETREEADAEREARILAHMERIAREEYED